MAMRARNARWLFRWASRWIDASYSAYVRRDSGEVPKWWPNPWHHAAHFVCWWAIPLAIEIDVDAAGAQMAEESWWG